METNNSKELPEYVQMEDEYNELCEFIESDSFKKLEGRIEKLGKFITENISPNGESINPDKKLTAIQMSYLTMQHQNMMSMACSARAYERTLSLRLEYEKYKQRKGE